MLLKIKKQKLNAVFWGSFVYLFAYAMASASQPLELRILIWAQSYIPDTMSKKFESIVKKKYQVDIKVVRKMTTGPEHIFNSLRAGEVDLATPTNNLVNDYRFALIKNKLILPINIGNIKNYKELPETFRQWGKKMFYHDGKHYGIPFVYGPYALIYNKSKLKKPPTSWQVLWDSKYAKDYSITVDHYEGNAYISALSLGYSEKDLSTNQEILKDPKFIERMNKLAKNASVFWKYDTADAKLGLSLSTSYGFALKALAAKGEDWDYAFVKEKTTTWTNPYVISHTLKDNPLLKRIAEEWIDFSLSKDYQTEAVVRGMRSWPVIMSIRDRLTPKEIARSQIDNPNFASEKLILWPVLPRRLRNGYKAIWKRALRKLKEKPVK